MYFMKLIKKDVSDYFGPNCTNNLAEIDVNTSASLRIRLCLFCSEKSFIEFGHGYFKTSHFCTKMPVPGIIDKFKAQALIQDFFRISK